MKWQSERPARRALRTAAAIVVLFGAAGIALHVAWVPGRTGVALPAVAPPAPVELTVHPVRRCPHCGWIESKREILPSAADPSPPGTYEYTLRMRDGSSSVFRETLPTTWRLGERLALIHGTDPSLK